MNRGRSFSSPAFLLSFETLNLFSIGVTFLIALGAFAYCRFIPGKSFPGISKHLMQYLGFIHFAVGYHYFFTSPSAKTQFTAAKFAFSLKWAACLSAALFIYFWPSFSPLVYTLFYLHAVENAVYHIYRLSQSPSGESPGGKRLSPEGLLPLTLILIAARLSPYYTIPLRDPLAPARLLTLLLCGLWFYWIIPAGSARGGWKLVLQQHVLVVFFAAVSFFFLEGLTLYDYFIIWHYVIWFAYTWAQKPADRKRLVASHLLFAAIYKALFLLADAKIPLGHPGVLPALFSPASFMAQTACHILIAFAFRKYSSESRMAVFNRSVRPALLNVFWRRPKPAAGAS